MNTVTTEQTPLRVGADLLVPMNLDAGGTTAYYKRMRQVEGMANAIPAVLPVWDTNKPVTKAVLNTFATIGARQFTTDPSGSLFFSRVRANDAQYLTIRVDGVGRTVTADDLIAEQFDPERLDNEMFLAALSRVPVFFRIPGGHHFGVIDPLSPRRPVSARVVVFLNGPRMVQFQPEYRD